MDFSKSRFKKYYFFIGILVILLGSIAIFDKALAIGLALVAFFTGITFVFLSKKKGRSRTIYLLFLIALFIHLAAVLFIYWTDFKPFGGGTDYDLYHYNGQEIAKRIGQGNFSLEGLRMGHYYSIIIGVFYFFTLPEMIIPQLSTAWLAAMSCLLVYWIVLELGRQDTNYHQFSRANLSHIQGASERSVSSGIHKRRATQKMAQIGLPLKGRQIIGQFLRYSSSMGYVIAQFRRRALNLTYSLPSKADDSSYPASPSGSKKWAFLTALLVALYPSYLYFGSTMLKDTLVTPLILLGLLFCLKLIKNFSWKNFLIFYFALTAAIHFRFYVGFALLFTFIISWLVWGRIETKLNQSSDSQNIWKQAQKKLIYTIIIFILLGFSPQISGFGYYGIKPLNSYINPSSITRFREVYYLPPLKIAGELELKMAGELEVKMAGELEEPAGEAIMGPKLIPGFLARKIFSKLLPQIKERPVQETGMGSSIVIETGLGKVSSFIKNSLKSFTYVILGPLPRQIKYYNQLVAFLETFPWYFLLFFIIKGAFRSLKSYRLGLPLLIFSLISLIALSLFITNFGIATRIRIPSFISLLCLIPLGFIKNNTNKNEASAS